MARNENPSDTLPAVRASQHFGGDTEEKDLARDRHYQRHDKRRARASENPRLMEHLERLPILDGAHHHRERSHAGQEQPGIARNVRPDDELSSGILKSFENLVNGKTKTQQRKR